MKNNNKSINSLRSFKMKEIRKSINNGQQNFGASKNNLGQKVCDLHLNVLDAVFNYSSDICSYEITRTINSTYSSLRGDCRDRYYKKVKENLDKRGIKCPPLEYLR